MTGEVERLNVLLKNFENIGQKNIFRFWDELDEQKRSLFLDQLEQLEMDKLEKFQKLIKEKASQYEFGTLVPFDVIPLPQKKIEHQRYKNAIGIGEKLLRNGQVAILLVAGGQGSRLGFDGPKGTFPVGPVTGRTLFQCHVEKVIALEKRYGHIIPFYIMTSETNHRQTLDFFQEKKYFGKKPESFLFFNQGVNPALDKNHKLLLAQKWQISVAPDGHGGLLQAVLKNKIIQDMKQKGVEYIFYFQVDNPLCHICDPAFLGYHVIHQSEMSAKTVKKRDSEEKLGNIGTIDGKVVTIEYSELSPDEKTATREDGRLVFEQGSIAIHVFSRSFWERLFASGFELPYHVAEKSIPFIDENGKRVIPKDKNGYKFEQFIFDAFSYANKVMVLETKREKDFSPIKNKNGLDSPETARRDLSNLYASWLVKAGYNIPRKNSGDVAIHIEISPLYADNMNVLMNKQPKNLKINHNILIE